MFKVIPVPVRNQILEQIKNGATVKQMADQFEVSPKTIYGWLTKRVNLSSQSNRIQPVKAGERPA